MRMSSRDCILAIDQGTTSSRAIVFDGTGMAVASDQQEFPQIYPADGWVEHDPLQIWKNTLICIKKCLQKAGLSSADLASIDRTSE